MFWKRTKPEPPQTENMVGESLAAALTATGFHVTDLQYRNPVFYAERGSESFIFYISLNDMRPIDKFYDSIYWIDTIHCAPDDDEQKIPIIVITNREIPHRDHLILGEHGITVASRITSAPLQFAATND